MEYRFFTLKYCDELLNFDDTEFQEFVRDKNIVSVTDQFFSYKNLPYWGILVRYLPKYGVRPVITAFRH